MELAFAIQVLSPVITLVLGYFMIISRIEGLSAKIQQVEDAAKTAGSVAVREADRTISKLESHISQEAEAATKADCQHSAVMRKLDDIHGDVKDK